ncbi:hypothetical protein HK099_007195, partial [Clydaea vesicula]
YIIKNLEYPKKDSGSKYRLRTFYSVIGYFFTTIQFGISLEFYRRFDLLREATLGKYDLELQNLKNGIKSFEPVSIIASVKNVNIPIDNRNDTVKSSKSVRFDDI